MVVKYVNIKKLSIFAKNVEGEGYANTKTEASM